MIWQPSLSYGISFTGEIISLYWITIQNATSIFLVAHNYCAIIIIVQQVCSSIYHYLQENIPTVWKDTLQFPKQQIVTNIPISLPWCPGSCWHLISAKYQDRSYCCLTIQGLQVQITLGPHLVTKISKTGTGIKSWISNDIYVKQWHVITHSCPNFNGDLVNSLSPSDAILWQRSGSILAQVMACCLMAPSHYLNQCWLIISEVLCHSSEGNFIRDTSATIH